MAGQPSSSVLSFAGWVPTITGHLSFSLIGIATGSGGTVAANAICTTTIKSGVPVRYVAVSRKRVTSDLPYNGWPVGWLLPWTKAEYILLGTTAPANRPALTAGGVIGIPDEIGVLRGTILVVFHHEDKWARRRAKELVASIRRAIINHSERAPRGATSEISTLHAEMHQLVGASELRGVKPIRANFELYRTGEARIAIDHSQFALTDDTSGPWAPSRVAELVARQMYYFLKDAAHRHYHHRAATDNLLPLVHASARDDTSWRRDTLWALVRSILEARRRNSLRGYKSALGMLAYADAFQSLLARIRRSQRLLKFGPEFVRWPHATLYDFSHTKSSLEATVGEREFQQTSNAALKSVIVATLLGAAALWLGALEVSPNLCREGKNCVDLSPWLSGLLRHFIEHPSDGFWVLLLCGLVWFGGRIQSSPFTAWLPELLDGWGPAIGASISRSWRSRLTSYSDVAGAVTSALIMLAGGAAAIFILGSLFGLW